MALQYLKPDFFIVGERKCGTSSLYRYLLEHPQVIPCKVKEPQFFSRSWVHRLRHWSDYQALFPQVDSSDPVELEWFLLDGEGKLSSKTIQYQRNLTHKEITGEASANTFDQVPPSRLKSRFSGAKPIVLLRNPVDRAFSHYRMFERFKQEGRRLPFTLTSFEEDAKNEMRAFQKGARTFFIGPGVYHPNLHSWRSAFGDEGVHVIITENLEEIESASSVMNELCRFLNIDAFDFTHVLNERYNTAPKIDMSDSIRAELSEFYCPQQEKLEHLINRKLPW